MGCVVSFVDCLVLGLTTGWLVGLLMVPLVVDFGRGCLFGLCLFGWLTLGGLVLR